MKFILKGIKGAWYYVLGNLLACFCYDRRYLKGRWFQGRARGVCSPGWEWVVRDAMGRIFGRNNKKARFPVSQQCVVVEPQNIEFDPEDLNNFQSFGIYYQAIGKITIGKGTYIGPNTGIITANHDPADPEKHIEPKPVIIGKNCWIGMNSTILPGAILGDGTVVGAGSVVTKSFPEGHCIIAGNPARMIKEISSTKDNK